jgi:hypothetical protein
MFSGLIDLTEDMNIRKLGPPVRTSQSTFARLQGIGLTAAMSIKVALQPHAAPQTFLHNALRGGAPGSAPFLASHLYEPANPGAAPIPGRT